MRVEDLINELEDMMDSAKVLPLTGGKAVVDIETALDILDEIQDCLPSDISQAKGIVAERNQIIAEAKKKAEEIVRAGEDKKKRLVDQSEIVKQAEAQAEKILSDAKKKAEDMKQVASDYVSDLMKKADETLTELTGEIRKTRQDLKASKRG